jgi:hypothetical protein
MYEDELMHYGRPGMKWRQHKYGVWQRHARYADGQPDPNAKEKTTKDKITSMSSKEADELYNRLHEKLTNCIADRDKIAKSYVKGLDDGWKSTLIGKIFQAKFYIQDTVSSGARVSEHVGSREYFVRSSAIKKCMSSFAEQYIKEHQDGYNNYLNSEHDVKDALKDENEFAVARTQALVTKSNELTSLGKSVYSELLKGLKISDTTSKELSKNGIVKDKKGYAIKSDTELVRFSTIDEDVTDKRVYASILKDDVNIYSKEAKKGIAKGPANVKLTFKADHDLLVATGEQVLNHVMQTYYQGNKEDYYYTQAYDFYKKNLTKAYKQGKYRSLIEFTESVADGDLTDHTGFFGGKDGLRSSSNYDQRVLANAVQEVREQLIDALSTKTYDWYNTGSQKEILDHFESIGYDVIVDAEDYIRGMEFPVIVSDPSKSLKKVKSELTHSGVKGMEWYVRRFQPYTQVPTRSGKIGKFIGSYTDSSLDHRVKELEEQAIKSWNRYKELRAKYGKNDERVKSAKEDANRDGAFYGAMNKRLNVDTEQKAEIGRRVLESINQNEAVSS